MKMKWTWGVVVAIALASGLTVACGTQDFLQSSLPSSTVHSMSMRIALPPITYIPSPNYNSRNGSPISAIVLHHTATMATAAQTAQFFQNPAVQVSSHYIVGRHGEIIRCVPDQDRAWHAGLSIFQGVSNVNNYSIGIEISNVGDSIEPYPAAQVASVVKLMAYLAQTYNIPLSRVTRHRDICIPPGRKIDTSNNFDEAYAIQAAQDLLDGKSMPPYKATVPPPGYDPSQQFYTVKAGDTFGSIADDRYDTSAMGPAIERLNPGATLEPGTRLRMPTNYDLAF